MNPKVSIIIPCYNMGAYLQETLDSVTSHPNKDDYEIIIVNDGSTDEATINLLSELEKKGFSVLNQENQGLAKTRNNGIKLAKGNYILPLDADNKIRHNYISNSIKILQSQPDIDVVYGNRQHFGQENKTIKLPNFNFPLLCHKNYIDACAIYRKSIWEKVNGYDEDMPVMGYEDWDFWLRIALQGAKFHHINEVTFDYRVRNNSMLSNTFSQNKLIKNYIYSKKELTVVSSIKDCFINANQFKHLKNSKEYKLGKLLLYPIRLIKK
ncbi:MAG: glycosyltransferase family A protein [Vicingaceae bacterium]|nr:glycosyltransferase family A protein [Vicingaceae bacterium]